MNYYKSDKYSRQQQDRRNWQNQTNPDSYYPDETFFFEEKLGGNKIKPFLFVLLLIDVAWMLYMATGAIRSNSIPFWVGLIPIIVTWLILIPPAMFNRRLVFSFSMNRLALLWFLTGTVLSLLNHTDMKNGILRIIGFITMAMIGYILLPAAYSWDKIMRGLRWVLVWGATISLLMCISNLDNSGIFYNPNTMGIVALMGLIALGGALPKKNRYLFFYIGLLIFLGIILLVSRSRTAIAGAVVCGLFVFWQYRKKFSMWFMAMATAGLLLAFSLSTTYQGVTLLYSILHKSGAGSIQMDELTTGRMEIWRDMLRLRKGNEITGRGIGTMVSFYEAHPHSTYVAMWVELGNIGFPGFLLWVIVTVWQAKRIRKYCDLQAMALTQNMFLMLLGIAIICVFEHMLGGVLGLAPFVFWITAGAISNAYAQAKRDGFLCVGT